MKHVWILNHYAIEPGGAGGTRHYTLAKTLPARGWTASIIAASTELNSNRQRLSPGERIRLENHEGVPFLWVRTPRYRGNGAGRLLNMLVYTGRVLLPSATKDLRKPDVIIGSSVHPFAAFAGALLARRYKVPFVFEVRDLWPQTLIDLGRIKDTSLMARALRWLERWLYRRAISIVVLLPRAVDYIVGFGIPEDKVIWIPNGVDLSVFPDPGPKVLNANRPFTLMYFGAHGEANGLENVVRAMALVNVTAGDKQITLRLIGDGPKKPALIELAGRLQLRNVTFEPPVKKSAIPALAAEADAFIFNLVDAPVFRYGISSNKLYDFMAGARPVIFCCDAVNNPVDEANCGITLLPGDPQALAIAIADLFHMDIETRNRLGRNARHFIEQNHEYENIAAKLASVLNNCTISVC